MADTQLLSVIIPAYNEEDGIASIVERVLNTRPALRACGADLELIVVDDGSRDRTGEIATGYAEVCLVRHRTNHGYGAALKTGFAQAQGTWLGFLDADGTYPPESFPALLNAAHQQQAHFCKEELVSRVVKPVLLALIVSLVGAQPALAYIDPNTGGMLFQILAALFASLSAVLLIFSRQVRTFVARITRSLRNRRGDDQGSAAQR